MENAASFEGRVFGRYRLERCLGEGGMGAVYLAKLEGVGGFRRTVAVKVMQPHLVEDAQLRTMFLDEARLACRIHHSNVCSVLDFGVDQGIPYMVLEYLDGVPFDVLLEKAGEGGRLEARMAARVVVEAARGLHAAHETRGDDGELLSIVHRDISPDNVFVLREGGVRVVDFGVARMRGGLSRTKVGQFKGKIRYSAPERTVQGQVDRRADVWSLGVVLWEATTGRTFLAASSFAEAHQMLRDGRVPRPSDLVPDYPPELQEIVLSALEGDPDRRCPTAARMADALEEYIYRSGGPCDASQLAALVARFSPPPPPTVVAGDFVDLRAAHRPHIGFDRTAPLEASDDETPTTDAAPLVLQSPVPPPPEPKVTTAIFPGAEFSEAPTLRRENDPTIADPQPRLSLPTLLAIVGLGALLTAGLVVLALSVLRGGSSPDQPSVTARPFDDSTVRLGPEMPAKRPASGVNGGRAAPGGGGERGDGGPDGPLPRSGRGGGSVISDGEGGAPDNGAAGEAAPGPAAAARTPGKLNLLAVPPAEVRWRGRSIGKTPLFEHPMPPGLHTLALVPTGGGAETTITVEIQSGLTTRQVVHLR